ncbi:MAG: hypothetical protein HQK77_03275 [Desulfobacterales bacterium]|nr:hypothetical protein [Desulfobacterales bacterium]
MEIEELEKVDHVDEGLVAMFLKMSPEERLQSNDNAIRTIMELRNAYKRQQINKHKQRIPVLQETLRQLHNINLSDNDKELSTS